jgi:FkbM family methyltransferase
MLLGKYGRLNFAGRFSYFDSVIYVPLKVPETLFVSDFSLYQGLREVYFANLINAKFREFELIDCGAYFGQVSMRVVKLCPGVSRVVAFDPSTDNCEYTRANLQLTGKPFTVINGAVSNYTGRATLMFPHGSNVPDSAYIEKSDAGNVQVYRIDDLLTTHNIDLAGKNLAIKLDVEGEEKSAVLGARRVIREAAGVCFFIELHPGVLKRNNQTAEELLQLVSEIRSTEWYVADQPNIKLSLDISIFDQIGEERICDVIGVAI